MNNIEDLLKELARATVGLKRALYRRDEAASTTLEGIPGPTLLVHTCMVCERSAAGEGAQVHHRSNCKLARLQRAQAALKESWPEMFTTQVSQSSLAECGARPVMEQIAEVAHGHR